MNARKSVGYTLIEILVGLTIIGLIFSFGYVSFRDFSRRQALAGLVKSVQGDLRLGQEQALAGQKPADAKCAPPNFLNGVSFTINESQKCDSSVGASYKLDASCSGGTPNNPIKCVDLPSGISISAPAINPILFKVLGQGTNIPEGENATITLTQAGTNNQISVIVSSGGEIK